ncbi:hypothetical protein [Neomegalonema sp.]|uniref:cell division protein FtsL n=1 Tax=Neomegalonema sp. TaxID=2039713 RepID=UPI0026393850|nr:hypothetical protein [Neomegalonema sp.]MDD2868951.1 hypothetical protein [Neomegalonema sp.]
MRRALTLLTALALMLAASYAHRVKIETRELEKRVGAMTAEVKQRRAAVATLNAEWAYLNRPERLLRLAAVYGEEMELKPRRPDAFAHLDEIPIPGGRLISRAPAPLDLSDLDAAIMGALNPEAPVSAAEAPPAEPAFPDYEEVVTEPEFVGEGVGEGWAEGALDPYAAALVESQALPPPTRSGPVAGTAPQAAPFAFQPPMAGGQPQAAPQGYAPPPGAGFSPTPAVYAPAYAPAPASAPPSPTGYALPPGAVIVPAPGGSPVAYPSAPAGFAPPAPYNGAAPTPLPAAMSAPQPVFAPDQAPPPRIEIWEPLP